MPIVGFLRWQSEHSGLLLHLPLQPTALSLLVLSTPSRASPCDLPPPASFPQQLLKVVVLSHVASGPYSVGESISGISSSAVSLPPS